MANGRVLMGGDQWSPDSTQNTMVTTIGWLHASRESIDKVQEQLPVPMTLSRFSCCYVIFHKSTMNINQLGFQKLFWRSWVSECKDRKECGFWVWRYSHSAWLYFMQLLPPPPEEVGKWFQHHHAQQHRQPLSRAQLHGKYRPNWDVDTNFVIM